MRVVPVVGSLRRRSMYKAVRWASVTALVRERFRIVHISLQRSHIHMIVEAKDKDALSRGMQGFMISAARLINTELGRSARQANTDAARRPYGAVSNTGHSATSYAGHGGTSQNADRAGVKMSGRRSGKRHPRRRGKVFADRYHAEVIASPTQARNALRYCLSNWRHHGEDLDGLASTWLVDPFSTGILFPGWRELESRDFLWPFRATYDPLVVFCPKTWLLIEGWKLAGPISARDVPGPRRAHAPQGSRESSGCRGSDVIVASVAR